MSMTMEQVVIQLHQELFTLSDQVAAESGFAVAVLEIKNLASAQVRKDTLKSHQCERLGREEDFQQCSKNTVAFAAGC